MRTKNQIHQLVYEVHMVGIKMFLNHLTVLSIVIFTKVVVSFSPSNCDSKIKGEVQSKSDVVKKIIEAVVNGPEKGKTYEELAYFADTFGNRMSGSKALEKSIDYILKKLKKNGLSPKTDKVEVYNWKRGKETVWITSPVKRKLNILGFGGTVGTKSKTIEGPVVVLKSTSDSNPDVVKGKMVVKLPRSTKSRFFFESFNKGMSSLMSDGAKAIFVTIPSKLSIDTPRLGIIVYSKDAPKIPVVSISMEDSSLFQRMSIRGQKVTAKIRLDDKLYSKPRMSRNVFVDLKGKTTPDEMVIVSGHIDSWDVGDGSMDDGGGAWISLRTVELLKKLGIQAKRTIRAVLFTGEEQGLIGAKAYLKQHSSEFDKISIMLESDGGTFDPQGLIYFGNNQDTECYIFEALQLLISLNSTSFRVSSGDSGTDIDVFKDMKIPAAHLQTNAKNYSIYYHSIGDRINVQPPNSMDLCLAVYSSISYVLADIETMLPR